MRGNNWFVFLFFVSVALLKVTSTSNKKNRFLEKFRIPNKKTNSAVNIKTKKAIKGNYFPLLLSASTSDPVKLINTGKILEIIELNPFTISQASGGVLLEDTYQYGKTRFFWTNSKNGTAGIQINGKRFPIEAAVHYFNKKYKTFRKSLHKRDGLVIVTYPVFICSTPSPTYLPFAEEVKKVLKAKSSTTTTLGKFTWYDLVPENVTYYAYPGSYRDFEINKTFYCATVIFPDYPGACITEEQYAETFGSIKDLSGNPLISKEKIHPLRQPVVEAHGIFQVL